LDLNIGNKENGLTSGIYRKPTAADMVINKHRKVAFNSWLNKM
jgi:hypothetical protein